MSMYKSSGEENLRADPSVKSGSVSDKDGNPPQQSIDIPKGVQKYNDDAHMRSDRKDFEGSDKSPPTSYRHDVPPGLQSFDDNGQKEGGTKYLGG